VRILVRSLLVALDLVSIAGQLDGVNGGSARGLILILVSVLGLVLVTVAVVAAGTVRDQLRPPY
jgi:hypothetical protein